ncbi:hypothetical protein ATCC90586_006417 [Pythium insidiosum]|nr:hypothetical protein ATCC90586_006417 [Pythium insidiosum]
MTQREPESVLSANISDGHTERATNSTPALGDDWRYPVIGVLATLLPGGDASRLLVSGDSAARATLPPGGSNGGDPIAVIADALQVVRALRRRFGADALLERADDTARACAWLSHVVDVLLELARLQDAESQLRRADTPTALQSLSLASSARVQSAEEALRQREAQLDEARAEVRDLRQQLRSAWAGEDDALRRCNYIDEQLDTCKAALETARRELAAHSQCADRLAAAHAEVASLKEQLLVARGRTTPVDTLSADQARHIYNFVWRHGCGQGDEELWTQLVHACATNDPSQCRTNFDAGFDWRQQGRRFHGGCGRLCR